MDKKTILVATGVILITLLAAGYRFYDIQNFPPGLFPDEAANGEDVLLILEGDRRPFYPRGNGREALFFYIQSAFVNTYGIGVWQLHLASALIGTLTVLALYFATRAWFGRLSGLLASFFLATSYWHVTMSRTGFRAIMIPLFIALFTAFVGGVVRSVKKGYYRLSYVYAALAGAAFGAGFYTYIAYRTMIGVVLGVIILVLLDDLVIERSPRIMPHLHRYWRHFVVAAVTGFIVFAPLGWHFIQNPADIMGRSGQVSIFNEDLQQEFGGGTLLGTLLYSTRETLMSFFASGDQHWWHSVSGAPLLNPLVGILFLLGLAWAIHGTVMVCYKIARGEEVHLGMVYPYLLLLILAMLLPVITTAEGIPHGLRSVGLVVPIFLLAGTAGSVVLYWLKRSFDSEQMKSAAFGIAAGFLILSASYDGMLYFFVARNDPGAYFAYRADLTQVSEFINEYAREGFSPERPRPYLVLDNFSLQTVHFLTSVAAHGPVEEVRDHPDYDQHLWEQLDPESSHLTPLEEGEIIIFTQSTLPDADRYESIHLNLELVESRKNRFGQEIMRIYRGVNVTGEAESLDA